MKIGIISDTHDNVENVKKAVSEFIKQRVSFIIHCGDIIAPKTVTFFVGLHVKFVKGNCDGDIDLIKQRCAELKHEYLGVKGELDIEGKKIGIYHGQDINYLEGMINFGAYDYVLTGHTHAKRDENIGKTRVINPGGHYYGSENTIAILDTASDEVKFITLK
jgi:uncharacterized protein